jgi:hypothetical protein
MIYDEGKVYLRDARNGNIYPYERFLAADKNFVPCIPNQVQSAVVTNTQSTEDGQHDS